MLTITEAARDKIKDILAREGKEESYVRIFISGVG